MMRIMIVKVAKKECSLYKWKLRKEPLKMIEYYEEGEVDLEAEVMNSLSDLKREKRKKKSLKEEFMKLKDGSHTSQDNILIRKTHLSLKYMWMTSYLEV
jgi:hypothetical protein